VVQPLAILVFGVLLVTPGYFLITHTLFIVAVVDDEQTNELVG